MPKSFLVKNNAKGKKKFLSDENEDHEDSELDVPRGQFRAVTRQVLTDDAAIQCNLDIDADPRSRAHYYASEEYHNHGLHTLAELCLRDIEPFSRSTLPAPPSYVTSSIIQGNQAPIIYRRNSVENVLRPPDILEPEDVQESNLNVFRTDLRTSSEERPLDDPSRTFEFERTKSEVSSSAASDIEEETDVLSDDDDEDMRVDIEGDDMSKKAISAKVDLELEKMLQGKQEIIAREVKEFLENNSVVMKEVAKDTGLTESDISRFLLEGWHLKEDKKRKFYKWYLGKKYSSPRKDENFTCYKCGKIFAYESYLQRHVKYVCPDKTGRTWKCSYCSKAFQYPCYLRRHMRSHTGESPYKCSQCSRAFVRSTDLQRHLRNHTGEKPYKCAECSRAFARSTDLKRHMRTHTGEKPYKCAECSKAFSQSGSLQTHLHTHYKDQINNKGSFIGKSLKS